MHRLPLILATPSYMWDRSAKDYEMIPNALNNENYMEMIVIMRKIEHEKNYFATDQETSAVREYNHGLWYLHEGHYEKAVETFNKGIVHASRGGNALTLLLKMRGQTYHKLHKFEGSTNDFELLLYLTKESLKDLNLIYIKLVIGYYMLGKLEKAMRYYKILDENVPDYDKKKVLLDRTEIEVDKLLSVVDQLYVQMKGKSSTPGPLRKKTDYSTYSLLTSKYNLKGLYFKDYCPPNTVVLRERPLSRYLTLPWLQCELCLKMSRKMYCCFKCHFKTYCSVACMRDDILHKDECKGLKYQLVIMLNCQNLFRCLIELIYLIQRHMLGRNKFSELKTPCDILSALRIEARHYDIPLLKLLANEPDYTDLTESTFATILASSVRLSIFIVEKTSLVKKLEPEIVTNPEANVAIFACLLMQLQYHLEKRKMQMVYDVPLVQQKYQNSLNLKKRVTFYCDKIQRKYYLQDPVDLYYNDEISFSGDGRTESILSVNVKPESPNRIPSPDIYTPDITQVEDITAYALDYSDSIAKLVLRYNLVFKDRFRDDGDGDVRSLSAYISNMDSIERAAFIDEYVQKFNRGIITYYYDKKFNEKYTPVQQILYAPCNDTYKIRHSCEPNVEIIFMDNGMIYAKTIKPVLEGEECLISYRCHYFDYNIDTREQILKKYGVKCLCKYCLMPPSKEPLAELSHIYCDPLCYMAFGKVDKKCPICGRNYEALLNLYYERLNISKTDPLVFRDPFIIIRNPLFSDKYRYPRSIVLLDRVSKLFFPPYNEQHMMRRLRYIKFAAANNFLFSVREVVSECFGFLNMYYDPRKVFFTYYLTILEAITLSHRLNLYANLKPASFELTNINWIGRSIIRQQIDYLKNNGTFEKLAGQVLPNYHMFLQWREEICYLDINMERVIGFVFENPRMSKLTHLS